MIKRLFLILCLMTSWRICSLSLDVSAQAAPETASEVDSQHAISQFRNAYHALILADKARDAKKLTEAAQLYKQAMYAYTRLAEKHPDHLIRFRIVYCEKQIETLLKKIERKKRKNQTASQVGAGYRKRITDEGQTQVERIASEAKVLLKKGETVRARSLLFKGLRLDPDNTTIRLLMGIAQCQAGKFEDATYLLQQLVEENPFHASTHVALGATYFGLSRLTEARKEVQRALKLNPSLSEAHYNMAQIMLAIRPVDLDAVRYHYKKARQLGGEPDKKFEFLLK